MRALFLIWLIVAACGGTHQPLAVQRVQPTLVLDITDGANQSDTGGKELAPIVARVRDSATSAPEPGQLVNWVVVSGGGTVFAPATLTDSLGVAKERWTLGWTVGDQVLEARAIDPVTGAPLTFARVHAIALAWFNVTVLVENQTSWPTTFSWQDGQGANGSDIVPGSTTRCERFIARDSALWKADFVNGSNGNTAHTSTAWFVPSSIPAWGLVVQPPTVLLQQVASAQC